VTRHGGPDPYRSPKSQAAHLLMEDVMYDPPAYLWVIIIAGPTTVAALTCIVLYGGAVRSGLGRRRAALLAAAAAAVFGGWLAASAVIAGHGWYRTLPWFPVAVAGYLGLLLALRQIPVVARALAAPGMTSRLELPHTPAWPGWPSCSTWPSATCRHCSPCLRAWATSLQVSPRRWWRAGSHRAPAAALRCGSTRSASLTWSWP